MTLTLGRVCISPTECRSIPHNQNARLHWSQRNRWNKAWTEAVWFAVLEQGPTRPKFPMKKPKVTITLHQIREMDYDNMYGAVKPVLDALKKIGAIVDDSPRHVSLEVKQKNVGKREEEGVRIEAP